MCIVNHWSNYQIYHLDWTRCRYRELARKPRLRELLEHNLKFPQFPQFGPWHPMLSTRVFHYIVDLEYSEINIKIYLMCLLDLLSLDLPTWEKSLTITIQSTQSDSCGLEQYLLVHAMLVLNHAKCQRHTSEHIFKHVEFGWNKTEITKSEKMF